MVFEKLTKAMRRIKTSWNLAVDVVVIDDTAGTPLSASASLRGLRVAQELRGLSDQYCMANGVRWRAVPIAFVSEDLSLIDGGQYDPTLSGITFLGPTDPFPLGSIDWNDVYAELLRLSASLWHRLVETLPSLGVILGVDLRGTVKERVAFRKRNGFRRFPEDDLYDAAQDAWFNAGRGRFKNVRALVKPSEGAIENAIHRLASFTFSKSAPESEAQFLYEMFPALLDALPHELFPQAAFIASSGNREVMLPADLVRVRGGLSGGRALITELKRGRTPLTTLGRRARASAPAMDAVAQARDYERLAENDLETVRKLFGGALESIATQVILGRVEDADQAALFQMRKDFRGVVIRGFDEVLDEALARWDVRNLSREQLIELYRNS